MNTYRTGRDHFQLTRDLIAPKGIEREHISNTTHEPHGSPNPLLIRVIGFALRLLRDALVWLWRGIAGSLWRALLSTMLVTILRLIGLILLVLNGLVVEVEWFARFQMTQLSWDLNIWTGFCSICRYGRLANIWNENDISLGVSNRTCQSIIPSNPNLIRLQGGRQTFSFSSFWVIIPRGIFSFFAGIVYPGHRLTMPSLFPRIKSRHA